MSRIFALVSVSTILLVATVAVGSGITESDAEGEQFDAVTGLIATQMEVTALVPLLLGIALLLAVIGVFARL